jgi:hypothetical protein
MASDRLLPDEFADLEPFAGKWALRTEPERHARRLASTMEDMQAFYDAVFPRTKAAIEYLNRYDLAEMPASAKRLLYLLYSLIQVSFPVEVWKQPETLDGGAIRFDRSDPD